MKLIRYNQLDPQVPTAFSGILDRLLNDSLGTGLKQFSPPVDISEDEKSYEIQVAVPGVQKSDFKIQLVDGKLTISGDRKMEDKQEGKNFHSLETHYGTFRRSFFIPDDVIQEETEASYEAGILKLVLPKKGKKASKATIEVK